MHQSIEKNHPLYEDSQLLISQSLRCQEILGKLDQKSEKENELHSKIDLITLLNEIITPYQNLNIQITTQFITSPETIPSLIITHRPELIYGIRNFVETAVQHAHKTVIITVSLDPYELRIDILDDGSGFPQNILSVLGESYIRNRIHSTKKSKGLELGIFIAITLLKRIHAH